MACSLVMLLVLLRQILVYYIIIVILTQTIKADKYLLGIVIQGFTLTKLQKFTYDSITVIITVHKSNLHNLKTPFFIIFSTTTRTRIVSSYLLFSIFFVVGSWLIFVDVKYFPVLLFL